MPEEAAVENQHEKIKGYRDLSAEEINLMNLIKNVESQVATVYKEVAGKIWTDKRWSGVARTDLEKGFSALVRAVARPVSEFDA